MKHINGTWLELHHFGLPEGKYFNPMCHNFSDRQWKEKVKEIASLDMHYIVLISIAFTDEKTKECYYSGSSEYPKSKMIKAKDPLKAILEEAQKHDIKVFLGAGIYGPWPQPWHNMTSKEVQRLTFVGMKEVYEKYGHYESFYGWYYPDETGIDKYFEQEYIDYVNSRSEFSRTLNPNLKSLIAPYGTRRISFDDHFVEQLKILDVDFVAYQDEVGVKKSTEYETAEFYRKLRIAHEAANRSALWADVETFTFEGDVYKSALLPAPIDRLERQLEAVSPYVDEVLVFEYQGMMNKPGTIAFCGHPDSIKYYKDYKKLLRKIKKENKK